MKKILFLLILIYSNSFSSSVDTTLEDFISRKSGFACSSTVQTSVTWSYTNGTSYSYDGGNRLIFAKGVVTKGDENGNNAHFTLIQYTCHTPEPNEPLCNNNVNSDGGLICKSPNDLNPDFFLNPENGTFGNDGKLNCNSGYSATGIALGIPACMLNPSNGSWNDNDDLVCDLHYHKDETGNSCVIDAGWNDLTGNLDDPTGTGDTGTGGTGTGTGDTGTGGTGTGTGGTGTGTGGTGTGGTGTGDTGTGTGTGDTGTGGTGTGDTGTGTGGTGTGGTGTGTGGSGTGGTGTGDTGTGTGDTGTDLSGVLSALEKLNNDNNINLNSTNLKLNQANINLNSIDSNINKINDYNKSIDDSISSVSVPTVESFTSIEGLSISDSFSSTLGNVSSKYFNIFSGIGNSSLVPQNIVFSVFGLDFTLIEFSVFNDYVDYIRGLFLFLAYFSSFLYFIRGAR